MSKFDLQTTGCFETIAPPLAQLIGDVEKRGLLRFIAYAKHKSDTKNQPDPFHLLREIREFPKPCRFCEQRSSETIEMQAKFRAFIVT